MEKTKGMWRFWWWHRLRGHSVIAGLNIFNPTYTPRMCEDCKIVWDLA